jgi:hypothetical protein
MLTKVVMSTVQLAVVFTLDTPVPPTIATVHIGRRATAAGGIALEPGAPREVGAGLPRREGAARRWDPGECGACGGP